MVIFAAIAFLGFLDASYLALEHYFELPLPCSITQGCEQVTTSRYSMIFGVPVALLGAAYYLFIFILAIVYLDAKNLEVLKFISAFTVTGFLASLWFLYAQFFLIGQICLYCAFSAVTSTLLFAIGIFVLKRFCGTRNDAACSA